MAATVIVLHVTSGRRRSSDRNCPTSGHQLSTNCCPPCWTFNGHMSLILLCTGIDRSYTIEELHMLLTTVSPSCVLLNSLFLYVVFGVGPHLQYCRDVQTLNYSVLTRELLNFVLVIQKNICNRERSSDMQIKLDLQ